MLATTQLTIGEKINVRIVELRQHLISSQVTKSSASAARSEIEALKTLLMYDEAIGAERYARKTVAAAEAKMRAYHSAVSGLSGLGLNATWQKIRAKELALEFGTAALKFQLRTLKPLLDD